MNEEIKKNEISEEQLEAVSGGKRDYQDGEVLWCPICSNVLTPKRRMREGVEVTLYHYCQNCKYREDLSPDKHPSWKDVYPMI